MEHQNTKSELLTNDLLKFKPIKILTSYILSSLKLNSNISREKINQIEKLIGKLKEKNFFQNLGGYYDNYNLIEMIFSLLNQINYFDPKKTELLMTKTIAKRLDSALKLKKIFDQEYLHEATFLVMEINRKNSKEFKISFIEFLQIFGFKKEKEAIAIADQLTTFLRQNKSISKLKMDTLSINENYEQLVLSDDCDILFHEKWFVPQNEYLSKLNSFESNLERREEEKDIDDEYIIPEENINTHCSIIRKKNSEAIFKSLINDVISKPNNFNYSKWKNQQAEIKNYKLVSSVLSFETIHNDIPEKPVMTDILSNDKNEEKKSVDTNILNKNEEKKKPGSYTLKILSGNISRKNSVHVTNNGSIKILASNYQINDGDLIAHKGEIKFGRKGGDADINMGEIDNGGISRNQFIIHLRNNDILIQCCSPPPKPTTAFRMNETPFFLEKDQIITFGKEDDFTFRISEIYYDEKEKYIIFQSFSLSKNVLGEIFKLCNKSPQIIGNIDPLHSPILKKYKIELGFDVMKKKWYVKEEKNSEIKSKHETFIYLFQYQDLKEKKSEPIAVPERTILNCDDIYLMRE